MATEEINDKVSELKEILKKSVGKIGNKKSILLFSGGIDSTILAKIMKDENIDFICVTAGTIESQDKEWAEKVAGEIGVEFVFVEIDETNIEKLMAKSVELLGTDVLHVSISIPAMAVLEKIKQGKIIVTGLGSDEIFGGYQSHQDSLEKGMGEFKLECKKRIKNIKNDVFRDRKIASAYEKEIFFPFLEKAVVDFGLELNPELKISLNERKIILRKLGKIMGLSEKICKRPKKAAQYGSGVQKLIKKILKKKGFKRTSEWLNNIYN